MPDGIVELTAMQKAYEALKDLDEEQQRRALRWLLDTFSLSADVPPEPPPFTGLSAAAPHPNAPVTPVGDPLSDVTPMTAKQFVNAKKPKNTAERLACLAYYSTHVRGVPTFKAPDLVALNTEAAGPRMGNPSRDVDNAERGSGYLSAAGGGAKQISPRGEALVQALPDRDAVKEALDQHPHRRRTRKTAGKKASAKEAAPAKKTTAKKTTAKKTTAKKNLPRA